MKNYVGEQSEMVVRVALEEMKAQGKILSFRQKDQPGIDFFVTLLDGRALPLQVKSSHRNGKKHRHRYPDIPLVVTRHHGGNTFKRNQAKLKSSALHRLVKRAKLQIEEILDASGNGESAEY